VERRPVPAGFVVGDDPRLVDGDPGRRVVEVAAGGVVVAAGGSVGRGAADASGIGATPPPARRDGVVGCGAVTDGHVDCHAADGPSVKFRGGGAEFCCETGMVTKCQPSTTSDRAREPPAPTLL
jgi:hypothetical protein